MSGIATHDLPVRHGTRGTYVRGCRCDDCRAANRAYARGVAARQKEAAAVLALTTTEPAPKVWTRPDGTKAVRLYRRACPGLDGEPCVKSAHLRKDSVGGVCSDCRLKLAWNPTVPAERAREHLRTLSKQGVGYKAVADAAGVARSVVAAVAFRGKHVIRKQTEARILLVTVDAAADHAVIDAKPVRRLIRSMMKNGFITKGEIAQELGYVHPALQIARPGRGILVRTAYKVRKLHDRLEAERAEIARLQRDAACLDCGLSHAKEDRLRVIVRELPATFADLQAMHPCWWGFDPYDSGARMLYRDLHDAGAVAGPRQCDDWRIAASSRSSERVDNSSPLTSDRG